MIQRLIIVEKDFFSILIPNFAGRKPKIRVCSGGVWEIEEQLETFF